MKWFFAVNEAAPNFGPIAQMIKVAVYSARENTTLVPHILYDGHENALTEWLQDRGVTVVPCKSILHVQLGEIAARGGHPQAQTVGGGAFLRTQIPRLAAELKIEDDFVFYSDCDVIFLREVVPELSALRPRYFSVAPEGDPQDWTRINTGAMLMNLPALRRRDAHFFRFMRRHLDELTRASWDQTAYEWFYNPLLRRLLGAGIRPALAERIYRALQRRGLRVPLGWQPLPASFNWKPYWGEYSRAHMIHFHGAKPHERALMKDGQTPENLRHLQASARGAYFELCDLWDKLLAKADSAR